MNTLIKLKILLKLLRKRLHDSHFATAGDYGSKKTVSRLFRLANQFKR